MWHQMLCWTADRVTWSVLVPPPGLTCLKKQELPQGSQLRPIDVQTLNRNPGFCRHWYSYSEGLGRPRISQVTFPQPQEAMTEARKPPPLLPPRLDWFVHTQVGQLAQDGVPEWFHGAISREDAEDLLESQPLGSFLIRVSHSHVGYTLSYKAQSSCCHFMVKLLDDGTFIIPGEKVAHTSLDALVTFHQQNPIEPRRELLTQPCRRIQRTWITRISSSTPTQWRRQLPARCLHLRRYVYDRRQAPPTWLRGRSRGNQQLPEETPSRMRRRSYSLVL
ncbi:hematopoietic SH2 domain-containing protein isoform X3 [Papio anubis]|uniref:hematopoietic SH2 domain-containing protein isoform X3 n=1 Tax=Papio anubis TaxID=9555 RepID=UPI0012ADC1FE|nr:hematopoietic SH2 domain-containing protein isoform X3 [Papio anubis]